MRNPSIDILRGIAILLMIQVHFVENLSQREASFAWLYDTSQFLGKFPAPLFTFLSGLSYCLWLRKQHSLGKSEREITLCTLRRGLLLFGAGIAFNVLVWLPEDTFNWDVLTLIGTSQIFLAFFRTLSNRSIAAICLGIVLASPALRAITDYPAYWEGNAYEYDFTLHDVVCGFFVDGYFPLFPWLAFPLSGYLVANQLYPAKNSPSQELDLSPWKWVAICALTAITLLVLGPKTWLGKADHYEQEVAEFPASIPYVSGMLGISMASLILLKRWVDPKWTSPKPTLILTILRRFSSFSLTVYVVHHMAHLWPMWIYGTLIEGEPTYFWQQATSTPAAIGLAILFTAVCYPCLVFLESLGGYDLEHFLRWASE
ncbi:MAG: heparan-alpha-glucosaminide N-acetyltransferase domain-containing protein [Planctomycetaceae bacterium]